MEIYDCFFASLRHQIGNISLIILKEVLCENRSTFSMPQYIEVRLYIIIAIYFIGSDRSLLSRIMT